MSEQTTFIMISDGDDDLIMIHTNFIQIKDQDSLKSIQEWDQWFEYQKEYLPQGTSSIHQSKRDEFNKIYKVYQSFKADMKEVA